MEKSRNVKTAGITLIALVITIIVLLILVGITINLTIGQGGILSRAQEAGIKSAEAEAKQKLELALLDLQAEKVINNQYNENEYIDNYLTSKQMVVIGNVVVVDGWQFAIDRSVPKIGIALGKGEESADITLTATVENAADYTKSTLNIEVVYEGEISSIQINGQEQTIPTKTDGKYVIAKEILENGTYTILVKDVDNNYKIATANVSGISEDLEIKTAEELVAFRDKVNSGASFTGKTITLVNDIDLSSICGESLGVSWTPIGTETSPFKGIFNGNGKIINNLYINNESTYQALFGYISEGMIKDLSIASNSFIKSNLRVAALVANNLNGTIQNCVNNAKVEGKGVVAGICSSNYGTIKYCVNNGEIYASEALASHSLAAGISSYNYSNIYECYNTGYIHGTYSTQGGITAYNGRRNC